MEINIKEDRRIVDVWMSSEEKTDSQVRQKIKEICSAFKKKKYMVLVFESGNKDLYELTKSLLQYNRRSVAETETKKCAVFS